MLRKLMIIFCLLLFVRGLQANVSGIVHDSQSHEVLIGANVWCEDTKIGTSTDNRGFFVLKLKPPYSITVSYIGYRSETFRITADTVLEIRLQPAVTLDEVTVVATQTPSIDANTLSIKQLEQLPALGGKPDVIKALQLTAGVLGTSEGSSQMVVRGGDPGQNQYLLDNIPLIYVNHLGGFMSVFNTDMINSINLYKGNFPARFGGKISSIVDLTQREGDLSQHKGSFSIGLTDAAASFEGPIGKNRKMSYMITARKTFTEMLMGTVSLVAPESDAIFIYGFHDVNAKLTYRPSTRNTLSLNMYQGDDYFYTWQIRSKSPSDKKMMSKIVWGNMLVSGRWNHLFSSRLFAENTLSYTRYRLSDKYQNASKKKNSYSRSMVQDASWRSNWKFSPLRWWSMEAGTQLSYLQFEPNYTYQDTIVPIERQIYHSLDMAVYWENNIRIGEIVQLKPSVRLTDYMNDGQHFLQVEPRVSMQVNVTPDHSLQVGYMTVSQNAHLLYSKGMILDEEIWFPAIKNAPPEVSQQFSGGWIGHFANRMYQVELGGYYKRMTNQVALKEGYNYLTDIVNVKGKIETGGLGIAYGTELSFRKTRGRWTGFASYCWSESTRQFTHINNGKKYDSEYSRPHSVVLDVNYRLNDHWNLNAMWMFQSGRPYTPVIGSILVPDYSAQEDEMQSVERVLILGDKNSVRMRPYHRLDVSATYDYVTKRGNRAQWAFSIYNLYCRQNPYNYLYDTSNPGKYDDSEQDNSLKLYQVSYFPIIPSFSWKVFFDYKHKEKADKQRKQSTNSKKKFN